MSERIEPDEFDDVVRNGPFVSSAKAHDEMVRLKTQYGLSFTHNPGGGEFGRGSWRCQVHMNDDLADLAALRKAVETIQP